MRNRSNSNSALNELEGMFRVVDFVKPGFLGTEEDFKSRYIRYREKTIRVAGGGGKEEYKKS